MSDKRTVHTDALETLGSIIGEGEKRDAIHIAVEPALAAENLIAGQDVGFVDGGFGQCMNPVGIVDPFLKSSVRKGERFWLLVYPRQITSLRHVWSHPAFGEAEYAVEDLAKENSEKWLRRFCNELDTDVTYAEIMERASEDEGMYFGDDIYGVIPDEFWHHAQIVLGKKLTQRDTYFSCAC